MDFSLNKLLPKPHGIRDQSMAMSMLRMMMSRMYPLAQQEATAVLAALDDATCAQAMSTYLNSLVTKSPRLWALKMLDATAKAPQGLLTGGWALLGNFDECLSTHAPTFDGQYCLLTACVAADDGSGCSRDPLETPQWVQLAEGETPARWRGSWLASLAASADEAAGLPLHVGLCVPSACGADDVTTMAVQVAALAAPQAAGSLHLETSSCQAADSQVFGAADSFALLFLLGLFLFVAAATAYDYASRGWKARRARLLLAFSAARNGSRLLATEERADALPALAGLRTLSVLWVTLHHALLLAARLPLANGQHFLKELEKPSAVLVTGGFLGLDTLLLLDGLLLSYVFLRRSVTGRPFSLIAHFSYRLARFLPSLLLVLFLQSTIFLKLGDGPLWNLQPSQQCPETWPYILLQVCNYFRPGPVKCMAHAWFLSLEWQLYVLAPLVLLLLRRSARRTQWALVAATAVGVLARFVLAFAWDLHPPWGSHYTQEAMKTLYFPTHVRFMPYVLGIALGYELHRIKHLEIPTRVSKKTMCLLQLSWPILLIGSLLSVHSFSVPNNSTEPFWEALHLALVHTTWALGVAIFVYLAATGKPTPGVHLLSFGEWRPLSRLSYGVYLLHLPFLYHAVHDTRFAIHLSLWRQIATGLLAFGMVLLPAAALWLALEAPMGRLEAMLCDPPKEISRNFNQLCFEVREFLLQAYQPFLDPAYREVESVTEKASKENKYRQSTHHLIEI